MVTIRSQTWSGTREVEVALDEQPEVHSSHVVGDTGARGVRRVEGKVCGFDTHGALLPTTDRPLASVNQGQVVWFGTDHRGG